MAAGDANGPDAGDELAAREAARIRRRDRDADAAARELMRPGMGKVFKQIQDAQAKAAKDPTPGRKRRRSR
jgi:hypothetical protein